MEPAKKKLVIGGLTRSLDQFEVFFKGVEGGVLEGARDKVRDENDDNKREYDEFVNGEYSNPTPGTMGGGGKPKAETDNGNGNGETRTTEQTTPVGVE